MDDGLGAYALWGVWWAQALGFTGLAMSDRLALISARSDISSSDLALAFETEYNKVLTNIERRFK
eukprot:9403059-Pyramimonas_sp.AAC.1